MEVAPHSAQPHNIPNISDIEEEAGSFNISDIANYTSVEEEESRFTVLHKRSVDGSSRSKVGGVGVARREGHGSGSTVGVGEGGWGELCEWEQQIQGYLQNRASHLSSTMFHMCIVPTYPSIDL